MSDEWAEDDEDWDDEYEEDGATGLCPECRAEIDVEAEMCPACGYWLTTADRHALWDGRSPVRGVMSVGKMVLVVILIVVMSGLAMLF